MGAFDLSRSRVDVERLLSERQWVQRLARSLVADPNLADDVAQESWLAALRHPPRHDANLKSWLSRLVRNTAAGIRRGDARRIERGRSATPPAATGDSSEAIERAEVVRELVDAVLTLDRPRREALVLVYFEGLAPNVAADQLGIPHSTFRTHVRRGLAEVREKLERKRGREGWLPVLTFLACRPEVIGVTLMKKFLVTAAVIAVIAAAVGVRLWNGRGAAPEIAERALAEAPRLDTELPLALPPVVDANSSAREPAHVGVPARPTTLTVAAVWDFDGSPISDLLVRVGCMDAQGLWVEHVTRTPPDGRISFDLSGWTNASCVSERGGNADVQLEPGMSKTVELRVPSDVRVHGRVLGENDQPVFGAGVYTSALGYSASATPLCTTDGDGRFDLGRLARALHVFAEHSQLGGSAQYWLGNTKVDEIDLVIRMQGVGHVVSGVVVDTRDAPVDRASVSVGSGMSGSVLSNVPDVITTGSRKYTFTDENGRFSVAGVATGSANVMVKHAGHGRSGINVEISAPTTDVRIVLAPAVRMFGVVRDPDGAAVPKAAISVEGQAYKVAGIDGSFEYVDIPPGSYQFEVTTSNAGLLQGSIDVPAAQAFEWNPVVVRGRVLGGRVIDEDGKPLAGWFLRSASMTNRFTEEEAMMIGPSMHEDRSVAVTDADGRFEFKSCTSGARRITVAPPDRGARGLPLLIANDVVPGRADVELRVDKKHAGVTVRGRAEDETGTPIGGARIVLEQSKNYVSLTMQTESAEPSGAYEFTRILPGAYELHVCAAGLCAKHVPIDVGDTTHIVDPIRLVRGGSIVVALSPEDAAFVRGHRASLTLANTTRELQLVGDEARLDDVEPGTHTIQSELSAPRPVPGPVVDVTVRVGETVRAVLDLTPLRGRK
jgi:RNA polymerase sigma-70 factor (ECF subfamily)